MSSAMHRIKKELSEFLLDPPTHCSAGLADEDNLFLWDATIIGPQDTNYENGIFKLKIMLTKEYPLKPPIIRFVTRILHPNISSGTGVICMDVLQKKWLPSLTISKCK
jgi:ubiquitin-conjugating enzyme E2 D/E